MKSRSTPAATRSLMKMALRFRAAWAVGLLLLSTLPLVVQAQFDYTTDNGKVTITRYTGPGGEVAIPSSIDGLPVTTIGRAVFSGSGVTSVTIPDSVTSLGDFAFYGCKGLTGVMIPDNVTSIGLAAFDGCNNLAEIKVGTLNSVYSSQDGVLFDNGKTAVIRCPPGKAGSHEIPNSVTSIGDSAFSDCSKLTSVTIPEAVINIGSFAFAGCTSLTSIVIPDGVITMGTAVFRDCSSLTAATVGNRVTSIADNTFYGCSNLTSILIGSRVTSIGYIAFQGCSGLTSISIPDSVTNIGEYAFYGCSGLTVVEIGSGAFIIEEGAFSDCTRLASVTIHSNTANIGYRAFYGCSSLINVLIGDSVMIGNSGGSIGNQAFYGCSSLTGVSLGNSIASIGYHAFLGCSSLTSIAIPDSVKSIGEHAFGGCKQLLAITVGALNAVYGSQDGVLFDKGKTTLIKWPEAKAGSYTIPNNVTRIGIGAFGGSGLTSVSIPNSVTSIGEGAFGNCSSLTNVVIPNSVSRIEFAVFLGCSSLTSVIIPDSVTNIDGMVFSDCTSLRAVHFLGNAPDVYGDLFVGDLVIIYYLPGTTGWGATFAGAPTALWLLPLAREDVIVRLPGNGVRVAISVLLENDEDPQGGAVQFVGVSPVSANGGVLALKEGQITYTPPPGVLADAADTFTYTISAGGGDAVGVVVVNVGSVDGLGGNLLSMEVSSEGVGLRFIGIVDTAYDIQRSPTLERPEWTTLGTRTADPVGRVQFLDTDPPSETGFYRTQKSPQP